MLKEDKIFPGYVKLCTQSTSIWPNDDVDSEEFSIGRCRRGDLMVIVSESNDHWFAVGHDWVGYVQIR